MKKTTGKLKKQIKGITLIALVVTIIVLLILAGVAINLTIGNNGIFTRAENATQKWEEASKNEQNELNSVTNFIDKYFNENQDNNGMTLVEMFKQAEIDGCLNLDGNCNNPAHLHIGDYVNYENPKTGKYTVYSQKSGLDTDQIFDISKNQLNWRVLGLNEETGGIKLIAGSPIKLNENDKYLSLKGANAYVYGVEELNKIGELYKNEYALIGRSVNIEDINQILSIDSEDKIKENNMYNNMQGIVLQYNESFTIENAYTPENWINQKTPESINGKADGYAYIIENDGKIIINNNRAKDMLFNNVESTGKAYWLASKGIVVYTSANKASYSLGAVNGDEQTCVVGTGGMPSFSSDGGEKTISLAVRPVVVIDNTITNKQIWRIPDKVEELWK